MPSTSRIGKKKRRRRPTSFPGSIRETWPRAFYLENWPRLPCPTCSNGYLEADKKTFASLETASSRDGHSHPNWEEEYQCKRFSLMLSCQSCQECVAVCGETTWEPDEELQFVLRLEPLFMVPPPPIFKLRDDWPEPVLAELRAAFSSFWSDAAASANHVRAAIENLLTDKGVKRFRQSQKGNRHRLSLHDRIEAFKSQSPEQADALFAIKWIGNSGSHGGLDVLSRSDLFDAFDLLSHVLPDVLDGKTEALARLAKGIVLKRGPLSARRRHRP